jgi:hypothetical protein
MGREKVAKGAAGQDCVVESSDAAGIWAIDADCIYQCQGICYTITSQGLDTIVTRRLTYCHRIQYSKLRLLASNDG